MNHRRPTDQDDKEGTEVSKDDGFNFMSEQVFDKVSKGKLELLETDGQVYAYASQQPLKLSGKCMLNICVPDTQILRNAGQRRHIAGQKLFWRMSSCESRCFCKCL